MEPLKADRLIVTYHPLSDDERQTEKAVVSRIGQHFATFDGPIRAAYDEMTAQTPIADNVEVELASEGDVSGWWVHPANAQPDRAILFLHGGAYMLGSAEAYCGFASQIASRAGVRVFVLDYPLAPEHPLPAAFDASVAAFHWLGRKGISQVAFVGDSAGGALALAALQAQGGEMPTVASVVVFSPWIDLTLMGASFRNPQTYDPIFKPEILANAAEKYLNGADSTDGRASPLYAIPDTMPPVAIQVGSDELLLDDAVRYARAAAEKGASVSLDVYDGLHHVFQRSITHLASARSALDDAANFVTAHWVLA